MPGIQTTTNARSRYLFFISIAAVSTAVFASSDIEAQAFMYALKQLEFFGAFGLVVLLLCAVIWYLAHDKKRVRESYESIIKAKDEEIKDKDQAVRQLEREFRDMLAQNIETMKALETAVKLSSGGK